MSILNVNQIQPVGGGNTITVSASDISAAGATITASSFVGSVTGTTSNASGATGDFSIADKIVHTGDTNTAIRFPAADTFTVETAGSERLRIRNDGRVQVKSGSAEIIAGEGASAQLRLTADEGDDGADYWRFESNHSTNKLNIATYATGAWVDKVSMTSAGKIGINETTPQYQLHVHDDTSYHGIFVNGNGAPRITFARSTTTTGEWSVGIDGTNGNNFAINNSADNSNNKIVISSSQISLLDNTYVGGNVIIPSGNGISFAATGNSSGYMASELLDDYEEGTFDPTISPNSGGSITLNSGYNTLSYTKIGRLVHISGQIRISSVSSPVGNTNITNLPFTAQSTTEQGRAGANCFYYDASAGTGNYYKAVPIHVTEGTTTLKILNLHALGGLNPAANDELAFALSYVAAS